MRLVVALLLCLGTSAPPAAAQADSTSIDSTTQQLWVMYQSIRPYDGKQLVFGGQARMSGIDLSSFASIDGRARINFFVASWLDMFPEVVVRYTREQENLNTWQLAIRGGASLTLPNTQQIFNRERVPLQRLDAGVLARVEQRSIFYSDGTRDSNWRGRLRFHAAYPLNNARAQEDGTLTLLADAEAFIPFDGQARETFAQEWRFRGGAGYRFNFPWRLELRGIWEQSRNTLEGELTTTQIMLEFRLRHYH